jgi:DNA-directed RNA polymerase
VTTLTPSLPADYPKDLMTITGGYLSLRTRAVKSQENRSAHTGAVARPLDGASLEALNWIQKTRWTLNKGVLAVVESVLDDGRGGAGLPSMFNKPFPAQVTDDEFAAMDKETKAAYMAKRGAIYNENKQLEGERFKLLRMLALGRQLATADTLWFPHTADFRGRFYPTAQDLHTQGDSLVKGLLTFAEGERLGTSGQWWLYVALANAFGEDKVSLQQRVDWTENNMGSIIAAARDPMSLMDFWGKADSPWEALALVQEVGRLADFISVNGSAAAPSFESTIPVRLDATCSGIQHLSAFMKDPLSASAVNVLPTGKREDIYGDVAKVALERIARDAVGPDEEVRKIAQGWLGHVERKTVKRAVMTTPYGVTPPGIKTQLINDGFANHFENGAERYRAAEYLKDVVVVSLDAKIGAPRTAMVYFQEVSQSLAEREIPMIWTTPSGFTVRQAYTKSDTKRVETLLGTKLIKFQKSVANEALGLDRRKQKSSSAPNVVHSYDAAHLALTAVAMKAEGIRDMAFVHDSFGTHAGHTDKLSFHVRDQFVQMYDRPALEQWRQSVMDHAGVDDIPALPPLGDLDVSRVMDSEFFFS